MNQPHDPLRRALIAAAAALPLASSAAPPPRADAAPPAGSKTLVAYFSRSGNTRVLAGLIQRSLKADLFEIRPALAYPEDYLATVEQARRERDRGRQPSLAIKVANLASYDTLYLGFPIWGETAPPIVRSFLVAHDTSGKALVPFVTHGGYGLGNSRDVLVRHAPNARIQPEFSMEADQERRTMEQVGKWLGSARS